MASETSQQNERPFGYNGQILHIDLTNRSHFVERPDVTFYRTYVGGSSLASYYLLKELNPGIDPLSADNVLVFACSVLTGAPLSGFNRFTMAAKSPLSNGFGETEAGGFWGPELKMAGFDAVIIKGRADTPVYLWIHDGEVEIRDAGYLWGQNNWETQERIREELDDKKIRVSSIGRAGENQVLFANVQHELKHYNGRTGMGAVMGAKNLKAVAVRGHNKMAMADPEKVKTIGRWHNKEIRQNNPANINLNKYGTMFLFSILNHTGILPTHNFRDGVFEGADKLAAEEYHETVFDSKGTCYACAVKCKREVSLKDEKYPLNKHYGGAEYETVGAFGSLLDIDNLPAVNRGNQICNLEGMDTISAGCAIAFAMECFEKGIITEEDTGGLALQFGDADVMITLLEEMVERKGFGAVLADGVKRAAKQIGRGAEKYAFHIKGSELPIHDGRGKTGMAMGYAISATGADHVESPHDTAFAGDTEKLHPLGHFETAEPLVTDYKKVRYFAMGQKVWGLNNCYGICNFCSVPIHALNFNTLVETVRAITGWDTSLYEILRVSERSNNMSRIFNNREGFKPKDDRVIRRWHEELPGGPHKGQKIDPTEFREALDLYYELSGWDKEGRPTRGKLVDLCLEWLID